MNRIRICSIISLFAILFTLAVPTVSATESFPAPGQVAISSGTLNVRNSPSTSGKRIAALPKESYVNLLSKSGDWYQVEYAPGKTGYCHASYICTPDAQEAAVNAGGLNLRSGPGTSHGKISVLSRNERVWILSTQGDWSKVLCSGARVGYVSTRYLSRGEGAISLSVPSFKQFDSRWADVTLGTSGKPMKSIGCATTGIAMLESHRTGKTITPDAMAKELRYTASGNVYWPSHFTVDTTSSSGYLSRILDLLRQGKPVLLGAKKASGSQHWVVITGFTGGGLTEANFTIQDPGSSSRTRLDQFTSLYPYFYKFFHY